MNDLEFSLPSDFRPRYVEHFSIDRIIFGPGSLASHERRRFIDLITSLYPDAERIDRSETPHNMIDLGETEPLARHLKGKRTLVFGELKDAVRYSRESGNTCPNYWHFSTYGFCPYGCTYCYLAGTRGVWFSPTVKIYLNLAEILAKIDIIARRLKRPTAFYLGKLQDGLALDSLTAYSTVLMSFFALHPYARQIILTKASDVGRLLTLNHGGKSIISWSLNPPEITARFEENVPSIETRIEAMSQCAAAGYPIRAVLMPLIPVKDWKRIYGDFVQGLLSRLPIQRLTLGGICSYQQARALMERKLGPANAISRHFQDGRKAGDGRLRYSKDLRCELYGHLIRCARDAKPDIELALCLEEQPVWEAVGLSDRIGRCNCVF